MKMTKKRFSETERNCYYTSLVFDNQTQEKLGTDKVVVLLNMFENDVQIKDKKIDEQQATIEQLESDKAIAEDYANIFEKENVKLRKKLNNYKATVLGFIWMMEQNGKITGKDDKFVKDLFKLINNE